MQSTVTVSTEPESIELPCVKHALLYVNDIGELTTSVMTVNGGMLTTTRDMTDCLDRFNNRALSRHLSTILGYVQSLEEDPITDSYVAYCKEMIILTKHVYDTRFRHDEWALAKDLEKLRSGCRSLTEGLLEHVNSA